MPKLEPIVNQEPKEQLVPTFNKKEVVKIVDERANEENAPLGYRVINLNLSYTIGGSSHVVPQETEDEKKLYQIFKNKEEMQKPIFLKCSHLQGGNNDFICGFVTVDHNGMYLITYDSYQVMFHYNADEDNVYVKVQEF